MVIKILGRDWSLEDVDYEIINGFGAEGGTIAASRRIIISDSLEGDARREVVIHELLHAIWSETGVGIGLDEFEERIVTALALGLSSIVDCNDTATLHDALDGEV